MKQQTYLVTLADGTEEVVSAHGWLQAGVKLSNKHDGSKIVDVVPMEKVDDMVVLKSVKEDDNDKETNQR